MRVARPLLAFLFASAGVIVVAAGCQEPTQVTLDVRIATATCNELNGIAINVGGHPSDTEEKVKSRFPTAETNVCDPATNRIGTLVITPSDEERASIIVVAPYDKRSPADCQPPLYENCIVARRQFTFSKNRRLTMPITIDPTCVNVPCDAFSTCRKGFCFDAKVEACEDGTICLEPGETANGGTNPDSSIAPDVGPDAPPAPVAACEGTSLRCGDAPCAPGMSCCSTATGATCKATCGVQYCCTSDDCGGASCIQPNGQAPTNVPDASSPDEDGSTTPSIDSGSDSGTPPTDSGTVIDGGRRSGLGICNFP